VCCIQSSYRRLVTPLCAHYFPVVATLYDRRLTIVAAARPVGGEQCCHSVGRPRLTYLPRCKALSSVLVPFAPRRQRKEAAARLERSESGVKRKARQLSISSAQLSAPVHLGSGVRRPRNHVCRSNYFFARGAAVFGQCVRGQRRHRISCNNRRSFSFGVISA
jgi:hypothetical protein